MKEENMLVNRNWLGVGGFVGSKTFSDLPPIRSPNLMPRLVLFLLIDKRITSLNHK